MKKLLEKNQSPILILTYALSRLFIWIFRPVMFTEVIYSYMPFAHLWQSGVMPYLEQWYEYPPATIPLFYIPHLIDKWTRYWPIHFDYLVSYRGLLLIIDILIFVLIWKTLKKRVQTQNFASLQVKNKLFISSIFYYILTTAKANHFIYDSMDLSFILGLVLTVTAPILWNQYSGTFISWLGTFLSIALKYINAPLLPLYGLLDLKKWKTAIPMAIFAFVVVWGIPLVMFRSSLLVTFVYHSQRGIQVDSAAAALIRLANEFTQSEDSVELYKNYDMTGPITDVVKSIMDIVFPLSIALYLIYGSILIVNNLVKKETHIALASRRSGQRITQNDLRIHLTLGYILMFMLTAKVLSTPFLLWHIPLVALYPFKTWKSQLKMMIPSVLIVFTSMFYFPNINVLGPIRLHTLIVNFRVIMFAWMFVQFMGLEKIQKERIFSIKKPKQLIHLLFE